jgi:hypothetical protein
MLARLRQQYPVSSSQGLIMDSQRMRQNKLLRAIRACHPQVLFTLEWVPPKQEY